MHSSDAHPVQIKASRNGFALVPDPSSSLESIVASVEQRLGESRDFFRHSEMLLDLRTRPLRTDEILQLHQLLVEKAGVKLVEVRLGEDLSFVVDRPANRASVPPPRVEPQSLGDHAPIIVRSTCRSGARVVSPSDCLVLGDINPGAEVIAVGDIVIFGNLRGMAHAGATGNRSARIWALSIEPNQLRIADLVAVPPRGSKPTPKRYEIAEVQNNTIEVITL